MDIGIFFSLSSILFLIVLSAFFSGAETGLTACSRAKIHKLETEGSKRAALVHRLREDKERLIGALLLGNTVVNILASALATSVAIQYLGEGGLAYATFGITLLVLIFAEVMPKTYAFYHAENVALKVAPVLSVLVWILAPVTAMVQYLAGGLLRLLGMAKPERDGLSGTDALRGAIALHHKEGAVKKTYRNMLDSVLDLAECEVVEVMTHRKNMHTICIDQPFETVLESALSSPHTRIPLWQDRHDNIVGILHVKDLLRLLQKKNGDTASTEEILALAKEPWFVPETTSLSKQLTEFRKRRHHLAMVVDEYGDLVGLVTLEDILEEIVGDIEDEHDTGEANIRKYKDGSYRVEGETSIRDLNRHLDWNLPDEEASTVAGLLIHETGIIPNKGEEFHLHGCTFKITGKKKNQITLLKISRP